MTDRSLGDKRVDALVGQKLIECRTAFHLSIEEAAGFFELPIEVYESFERGDQRIPVKLLSQLANEFDVPIGWFFDPIADLNVVGRPEAAAITDQAQPPDRLNEEIADLVRQLTPAMRDHVRELLRALVKSPDAVRRVKKRSSGQL